EKRQDGGRGGLAIDAARHRRAAEARTLTPRVLVDEFPHLIDRLDAVPVAVALRVAPREQAVAAEHDAVGARMPGDGRFQHHRQLEAGALPRHPDDPSSVALVELLELLGA